MTKAETKWMQFHDKHLQKMKLQFADWFHKKFPGKYCWADCVSWANDWRRFNPFKIHNSTACERESFWEPPYTCYCGAWNNGKCYDLLSEKEKEALDPKENLTDELPF